jgi:hypothetical protein
MEVMAKPSQVILLVEDSRHQQFIFRYLRMLGLKPHAMRVVKSPSGACSAEQWIRERFAIEVEEYRSRHAETKLIVLIDADTHSVQQRLRQLDQALHENGVPLIYDTEEIARLVPKRNIETWILCLNEVPVDEIADYKRNHNDWTELIRAAAVTLYGWSRPNASVPLSCVESLQVGIRELRRLNLR